jgi:hypothetical protein
MKIKNYIIIFIIIIIALSLGLTFYIKNQTVQAPVESVTHSDQLTGISFEYPVGWSRFGKITDGFMLNSPEEKSVLIISYSKNQNIEKVSLDQLANNFLSPFENDNNYQLISNIPIKIDNLEARDMTFSYKDKEDLFKVRLLIIENSNGYIYNFALYSSEAFEKDMPDFNRIIKSIKFK